MTVVASILGAVRNNTSSSGNGSSRNPNRVRSTYEEIGKSGDEEESSQYNFVVPSTVTNFKFATVLVFAVAFLVLFLCLNYDSATLNNNMNDERIILKAAAAGDEEDVLLELSQGSLRGKKLKTRDGREILGFYGIPYAKPPLGELRFQPPVEAGSWEGVLNATDYREECIQNGQHDGSGGLKGREDCLYLNVFTPKNLTSLRNNNNTSRRGGRQRQRQRDLFPVMFYIHGGGLAGNIFPNRPDYLLDENVILVTSHYRLGILGTLNTFDAEARGNQGLKDQSMALKWVQQNIGAFGGDSSRVTLFGNSYGSIGISLHLLSPMSTGLFHRVICQSGNVLDPAMISLHPREDAFNLGSRLNCTLAVDTKNSTELLTCLRNLDATELIMTTIDATIQQIFLHSVEPPSPTGNQSDVFLPDLPLKVLTSGKVNKVSAIFGVNSAEGLREAFAILNAPGLADSANEDFDGILGPMLHIDGNTTSGSQILSQLREFYFGSQNISEAVNKQNLTDMFSDRNFVHPAYLAAGLHLNSNNSLLDNNGNVNGGRRGNRGGGGGRGGNRNRGSNNPSPEFNVYLYYLTKQVQVSYFIDYQLSAHFNVTVDWQNGSGHVDELQYLFPYSPPFPLIGPESSDYNFSKMVVRLWTSFAETGKPESPADSPAWEPIADPKPYLHYQIDDEPKMTDMVSARMNLWDSFNMNDIYI